MSKSIYIPRGINTDALDRSLKWDFDPINYKVCSILTPLDPAALRCAMRRSAITYLEAISSGACTRTL